MKKNILWGFSFLLILDSIIVFALSSINLGTLLPLLTGLAVIAWLLNEKHRFISLVFLNKKCVRVSGAACLAAFVISFIAVESLIISRAYTPEHKSGSVSHIIILGAGLKGIKPSITLEERLDKAIVMLQENKSLTAIVSGGKGIGENISEAAAMRAYLMKHGIDMSRIILEDRSVNTLENFKFSRNIFLHLDPGTVKQIAFITNGFHIYRASVLSQKEMITALPVSADTPYIVMPNCYVREYFAVIKSFLLD